MADTYIIRHGPLAQIASGIRERLELAFPPNMFTYQWMPSRIDRDVWMKLTRRVPMIGIGFNRFHRVETTASLNVLSEWSVYVATKNESGQESLLFGDKLAPGLFDLVSVAGAVLHGFTLRGLGSIQVTEAANSFVEDFKDDALALAAIELTIPADLSLAKVLGGEDVTAKTLDGAIVQWSFDGATIALTDTITNGGA